MLKVTGLEKHYEGKPLLCGVSFTLAADETACLLARSGGGKSTILRIIAGLEQAESGQVIWDGQDLTDIPPHRRGFGFMFQDYALFPHLNVFENVAFGLRVQKLPPEELRERVSEVLEMVGMESFYERSVIDLSGGEKQRIAFARAIAPSPKLLMLDEPMGALDRTLRDQLLKDLQRLLDVTDVPVIYVTHDQEEAFAVADRIMILHDGHVVQSGKPQEVYSHPINIWTASFLGLNNQMDGKVSSLDPLIVDTPIGPLHIRNHAGGLLAGERVDLLVTDISVNQAGSEAPNSFSAEVTAQRFLGRDYQTSLLVANTWNAVITLDRFLPVGEQILITIPPVSIYTYTRGETHENCQE
jgi:ABC-type Fe3+/spermidine/putrescine transport system ATPase subunit